MAINPETQYPGRVSPASVDYPYGAARNPTIPGDGTNTPYEAALVNDIFGWQQALLTEAGIIPSGTPEKVGASQYLQALKKLTVFSIDSAAGIESLEGLFDGQRIAMLSRLPGFAVTTQFNPVGGGTLAWDSTRPKADHDGINVFSPTVPWTTTTIDYLNAVGETDPTGDGSWVRADEIDGVYTSFAGLTDSVGTNGAAFEKVVEVARALRQPVLIDGDINTSDKQITLVLSQGDPIFIKGAGAGIRKITSTQATTLSITSADPAVRGWYEQVELSGLSLQGDGVTTNVGLDIFGAAYANTKLEDLRTRGYNLQHIKMNQCWATEIINCQIGFGTESRTTSGTIGIDITNANAVMLRDSIITSIGLNFDGTGFKATSAEAVSIDNNTIENMQTFVEITSGSGSVSIGAGGTNYFENSTTVQGLRDNTQGAIKLGTTGKLYNADVSNNWFLVANNAINVDFENVSKGRFSQNTHNPNFANDGYWKAGANSTDIIIENNKRIFLPIDGVSGVTATDVLNTENAANELDKDTVFYPAADFIIDTTEPNSPTSVEINGAKAWRFAAGQDAEVSTFVMPPQTWGKSRVKTYGVYSISATSTDDIVFFAIPTVIQEDGTEVNPGTISFVKDLSSIVAADAPIPNTFAKNWIVQRQTRQDGVKLRFKRSGTNINDTFAGTVDFYGMILERNPNIV